MTPSKARRVNCSMRPTPLSLRKLTSVRSIIEYRSRSSQTRSNELTPHNRKLVESAKGVLRKALDRNHVAWLRLARQALGALPLQERAGFLTDLLAEFGRVWPMARDISHSIHFLAQGVPGDRADIVDRVGALMQVPELRATVPDFGWTWLIHSFVSEIWPGLDRLPKPLSSVHPMARLADKEPLSFPEVRGTSQQSSSPTCLR